MISKIFIISIFFIITPYLFSHPDKSSSFQVEIYSEYISIKVHAPLTELNSALSKEFSIENLLINKILLKEYILKHIKIYNPDGIEWESYLDTDFKITKKENLDGERELQFNILFYPKEIGNLKLFIIESDFINREVLDHQVLVYLRKDWESGIFSESPNMIGNIRFMNYTVLVDRKESGLWIGFKSTFYLGMKHISEGYDHMLFLIMLLLPAPLIYKKQNRINRSNLSSSKLKKIFSFNSNVFKNIISRIFNVNYKFKKTGETIFYLVKITTSFTVGHSITLILGVIKFITPPIYIVEILIAISVLISSIHVVRPFLNDREFVVAGGFGLVHGLAFSETLSEFGLHSLSLFLSILGFNLGVELIQLVFIFLFTPILFQIIKYRRYTTFKNGLGIIGVFISIHWIIDRI